jgi:dephospho-CoA kinase
MSKKTIGCYMPGTQKSQQLFFKNNPCVTNCLILLKIKSFKKLRLQHILERQDDEQKNTSKSILISIYLATKMQKYKAIKCDNAYEVCSSLKPICRMTSENPFNPSSNILQWSEFAGSEN